MSWLSGLLSAEIFISTGEWGIQMPPLTSENSHFLRSGPQEATLVMSEEIAHSLANRLETVRVSHWPITWPIYLPCTVARGQSHCASNIISNSHPFHSKWVKPPNPELQQFQYSTLKIQGQGHGWGQSLKSQCESNILSTHIPFVPCQSAIPFLRYDFFKIWP